MATIRQRPIRCVSGEVFELYLENYVEPIRCPDCERFRAPGEYAKRAEWDASQNRFVVHCGRACLSCEPPDVFPPLGMLRGGVDGVRGFRLRGLRDALGRPSQYRERERDKSGRIVHKGPWLDIDNMEFLFEKKKGYFRPQPHADRGDGFEAGKPKPNEKKRQSQSSRLF